MPTLSRASSTSDLTARLSMIFEEQNFLGFHDFDTTADIYNDTTAYEFSGTLLAPRDQPFGGTTNYFLGFIYGTIEGLLVADRVTPGPVPKITGLNLNVVKDYGLFVDFAGFAGYLSGLDWTITATDGNDTYDLSNLSGFHTSGRNVINLLGGDDLITGGTGVDIINSGTGNDTINDSVGNDVARGGLGDDVLGLGAGANGNDRLYGDIGNDTIAGGVGKDKLFGGAGHDVLDGGTGNDLMNGGKGRDTQDGGAGSDVFVFGMADGADLITGFELDFDTLRISAASVRITQTDGDAVVRFGTTAVTLDGIAKADLVMGDHIILI